MIPGRIRFLWTKKKIFIPLDIFPCNTDMDTHTNVVYICKIEMIGFDGNVPFFNLLVFTKHRTPQKSERTERNRNKNEHDGNHEINSTETKVCCLITF